MPRKLVILDISLPLHERMPLYPGSPPFKTRSLRIKASYVSTLALGSHVGTHLDAPRHIMLAGTAVDQMLLQNLIGVCRVLDLTDIEGPITAETLEGHKIHSGERILVKTRNSLRGFKAFYDDYVFLEGGGAAYLARKRIALFGIDALSVQKRDSEDNSAHRELLTRNIAILEGLDLARAAAGRYFLIALPLKLVGLDGAPARVVLMR
ncbi:MAG: cyclase family protein [bacterium]|nr:cyclase family protein [bacterium]MDZ4296142.1 cyclase family protein [Patescibacteria group bacterium]